MASGGRLAVLATVGLGGMAASYWLGKKSAKANAIIRFKSMQEPIKKYVDDHSLRLHPAQQELIQRTKKLPYARMLSGADEMQLLQNLAKAIGVKKALDIGVFTGYSAMSIAMVLPKDGRVVACDSNAEGPEVGRPFWKQAGVEHKIDLRIAPAMDTLQKLIDNGESGTFDFAFIDADKQNYMNYYEMCLKLVRPGGIIAVDNVLWGGRVLEENPEQSSTQMIKNFNAKLATDDRIRVSMLRIADGLTLAFKC